MEYAVLAVCCLALMACGVTLLRVEEAAKALSGIQKDIAAMKQADLEAKEKRAKISEVFRAGGSGREMLRARLAQRFGK